MKDFYKILEVCSNATMDEINTQHRFLVHAWHPDKFPNKDQKIKAEEKLKNINEAYSILSDPIKREKYNREFLAQDGPIPYEKKTQASQQEQTPNPSQAKKYYQEDLEKNCDICGMPTETKYVEFHENIGFIIFRTHRAIKGNLCRDCIDYSFWNLTGRTMLFGWWGVISFFSTILILINNIFRYIFSRGMSKPTVRISPNPNPFWKLSTIGGLALIIYFLFLSGIFQSSSQSVANSPITAPAIVKVSNLISNPTPISTKIKAPSPTMFKSSTPYNSGCTQWSDVTTSMVGKNMCVYGTSINTDTRDGVFYVLFGNGKNDFYFVTYADGWYEDIEGNCVRAWGEIQKIGNTPMMAVSLGGYKYCAD